MPAATKHGAVTDKVSSLVRREFQFGCAALTHFDFNIQFANANPMSYIRTFEHEHNRPSLLQRDFPGLKCKTLCRDLDSLRGIFSPEHWRRNSCDHEDRGQQDP